MENFLFGFFVSTSIFYFIPYTLKAIYCLIVERNEIYGYQCFFPGLHYNWNVSFWDSWFNFPPKHD